VDRGRKNVNALRGSIRQEKGNAGEGGLNSKGSEEEERRRRLPRKLSIQNLAVAAGNCQQFWLEECNEDRARVQQQMSD